MARWSHVPTTASRIRAWRRSGRFPPIRTIRPSASARASTPEPSRPVATGSDSVSMAPMAASSRGANNRWKYGNRESVAGNRKAVVRLPATGSRNAEAGLAEEAGGGDQGQADQGRRVLRLDGLEQHDAQPLRLEAARAIERLLGIDVTANLVIEEIAEPHRGRIQRGESAPVGSGQAHAGPERDRAPAHALELCDGALAAAGLAQGHAVELRHLVRPQHPGIGI